MKKLLLCTLLLASCHRQPDSSHLLSLQLVDRNGQTETISQTLRVKQYEKQDFTKPQPYEKILRVYTKNSEGKNPSILTTYHKNGGLFQHLEALDGRAYGHFWEYYESGSIRIKAHVIEGTAELHPLAQSSWVFDGPCEVFYPSGAKQADFSYNKGKKEGIAHYYYPDGQPQKILHFIQDEACGELKEFYPSGALYQQLFFDKGVQDQEAFLYAETNQLLQKEIWDHDLLQEGQYFDATGALISEINHGKGIKSVLEKGVLKTTLEYCEGKPEGLIKVFDGKGFLESSYQLSKGEKEGEEIIYYPGKTQPKVTLSWHQDQISGIVKTYYESGALQSQKTYSMNKKNGPSTVFYEEGSLMMVENYHQDKLSEGQYYKKNDSYPMSTIEGGSGTATFFDEWGNIKQEILYEKGKVVTLDY